MNKRKKLKKLKRGEATINTVRKANGLLPLKDKTANRLLLIQCDHECGRNGIT